MKELFPRESQQQAVGEICRNQSYDKAIRDDAFQLLCEFAKSDGEYFVAIDELTKTLEQEPEFFFEEMSNRKESFELWTYSVESTCFVAPYLYTNKIEMEKRRVNLVNELEKFEAAVGVSNTVNSMCQTALKKLKKIKVRVVE